MLFITGPEEEDSRDQLAEEERTDPVRHQAEGAGDVMGRPGQQKLRDRACLCRTGKRSRRNGREERQNGPDEQLKDYCCAVDDSLLWTFLLQLFNFKRERLYQYPNKKMFGML